MQPQVYKNHFFRSIDRWIDRARERERKRERERERERERDDDGDDIVHHTQPVFRYFTCGFLELNLIIDRVVEDGLIAGGWALEDLTTTPTPPTEILSILSVGLFNVYNLSFMEWFTTYNV